MAPVSPPSTGTLKMVYDLRHIFKVWGIAREEHGEYGRLLKQLLTVRAEFLSLGKRSSDAVAYRYPFCRELWEDKHKPLLERVLDHLADTLNTLRRFGWTDSEVEKFPLLFFPGTAFANVAMTQAIKGEVLIEALYTHEGLLRGLQKKRAFSDIERRLAIANKRATGFNTLS